MSRVRGLAPPEALIDELMCFDERGTEMLRLHRMTRQLIALFMFGVFTITSLGAAETYWFYGRPLLGQGEFPLFSFLGLPGVDWYLVNHYLSCWHISSPSCLGW